MSYQEFANYYDLLMEDMPYPEWIQFVQQCWDRLGKPEKVVELGCGTGNLTIPLAQNGFDMIGIDLSSEMLAVARRKQEIFEGRLASKAGTIRWLQQDMREWQLLGKVDAVISFCDCLNYIIEEDELVQTFQQVYEGLNGGGTFIFDVHTPYQLKQYAKQQPFILNEENISYIWTCLLDADRCEIEHELTIFAKEWNSDNYRRIDELHIQRAYPVEWIKSALEQIGFQKVESFADFKLEAPTDQTERAFFAAVK